MDPQAMVVPSSDWLRAYEQEDSRAWHNQLLREVSRKDGVGAPDRAAAGLSFVERHLHYRKIAAGK